MMAGTVTVACKLPNGLHLDLPGRDRVTVRGFAVAWGEASPLSIVGGFGLTPGVDADFFEEWMITNADFEPVKKGLIFASAKASDATAQAKEFAGLKSGLEPLDPDKPGPGLERVIA